MRFFFFFSLPLSPSLRFHTWSCLWYTEGKKEGENDDDEEVATTALRFHEARANIGCHKFSFKLKLIRELVEDGSSSKQQPTKRRFDLHLKWRNWIIDEQWNANIINLIGTDVDIFTEKKIASI